MIKSIGGWKLIFILQAVLLVAAILWIALGRPNQDTQAFLSKISEYDKVDIVLFSAEAQAYSERCGYRINTQTDAMAYKIVGLRKSHLAKKPDLRKAFEDGYSIKPAADTDKAENEFCAVGLAIYGEDGSRIPGLLSRKKGH